MAYLKTREGNDLYYKDWGSGQPVVFCHGWPLNSDSWESQMLHFANNGFRAIAHDRRGHGRSSQPWDGNDMDHYADDLAELIEHLDADKCNPFRFLHRRRRSGTLYRAPWHWACGKGRFDLRRNAIDAQNRHQPPRNTH